jgi:hypothetical protein
MSRSYRKTPIFGICRNQHGQKKEKQAANRKFRRVNKYISHLTYKEIHSYSGICLSLVFIDDSDAFDSYNFNYRIREVSDVWEWSYDGKYYWHESEIPKDIYWKIMGK